MSDSIKILLVEDNDGDARLLREALAEVDISRFQLVRVERLGEGLERLAIEPFDVILLDLSLPDAQGLDVIVRMQNRGAPVVVLTGLDDKTFATTALREGVQDYLVKGQIDGPLLERSIRYAIERHRAEELIQHQAYYDTLTGLPNRNLFRDRLQEAILDEQDEQRPLGLIMMDLDRFKDINDALGHQIGDLLLHQIGPRMKEALRPSDLLSRLGGDEFAVLLAAGTNGEEAEAVAAKILGSLERPFVIGGLNLDVEASIGIVLYPDHGTDADTLLKRVDIAMYMAKENRSGYAVYSPEQDESSSERLMIMGELRRAIVDDQLSLLYQPKLDLKSGQVCGVEALVRWHHPELGVIVPGRFIPLAERTGLIMPLTLWVLHEALRQCRAWHELGFQINMAVNISRHNLQAQELPDQIMGILKSSGACASALELEITESAIMANPTRAMEVLARMTNLGLRFSLDDFGTGHSSLAHLKKLPVSELKIDKSFVMNMRESEQDVAIVRLIIELGHVLKLKVVAEGVENQETKDQLLKLGCDTVQGFFICRPIPAEELTQKLLLSLPASNGAAATSSGHTSDSKIPARNAFPLVPG